MLQGIMLVYDITNEKSFDNIRNWIRNIEEVHAALTSFHINRNRKFSPAAEHIYSLFFD